MIALKNGKTPFAQWPEWKINGAGNDGRQPIDAKDNGKSGQANMSGGKQGPNPEGYWHFDELLPPPKITSRTWCI